MNTTLRDKLTAGQILLGLGHMYPAAGIIEGMGVGWDFSWIDMQHGQHDFASTLGAIRAAECMNLHPVVRVPGHSTEGISKVADMDPDAVMVPMVNDASQAKHAVDALRFPPVGARSYGGRRVIDRNGRDYYKDRDIVTIVQIETLEAVERAEEIAATEGVDVLFFGPDDMKLRMGLDLATPVNQSEQLTDAQRKVAAAAKAAGKWAGSVAVTPELLRLNIEMGYQFIVGGGDIMFLRVGGAKQIETLREVADGAAVTSAQGAEGIYGN